MAFQRRRSSLGGNPDVLLQEADPLEEAKERRNRQKKRQSAVGLTPAREVMSPKKSGAFLAEHYTNCIKLSAENKINVKNAFSLQLIDYLAEKFILSRSKGETEESANTFQAASCALDASTKIYAYRVDSVHTDALKLAGGVGSGGQEDGGNYNKRGGDSQDDEDFNEDLGNNKKKALKRSKNTIEKNLKNITLSKMELNFDVDPLFKKTTSQYDSGGGGNYFVNTLYELDDEGQLIWDPDAPLYQSHFASASQINTRPTLPNFSLEGVQSASICPVFEGFNFREWTLEEDDLNSSIIGFSQPMTSTQKNNEEGGEHAFDIHAPVPEDFDDFTAADAVMDTQGEDPLLMESQANAAQKGPLFTDNLRDILTSVPLEYSYFDHNRMGSFAGPKHWKFRQPIIRAEIHGGDRKEGGKKKTAKEDVPLDFAELDKEKSVLERVRRLMRKPKKTTRLQHKTVQSWTEDKRMSPEELRYKGSDFVNLDLISIVPSMLSEKGMTKQAPLGGDLSEDLGDIGDYDYDNVNDAENFCPADMANSNYDEHRTLDPSLEVDGLVSAPNKVEKINISYAKLAKKVDMKRLKYVEWDILKAEDEEKENVKEADSQVSNQSMTGTKTFSQLYKNLESSSKMPPKMIENLSVPLAFAALLHLCNENSLRLQGSEDLKDFVIMQG